MLARAVVCPLVRACTFVASAARPLVGATARSPRSFVSINGQRVDPSQATVSVFDTSVQRGNGAFEVVRVLPGGQLRAPSLHLARLERTAAAIELPLPPRDSIKQWLAEAAAAGASEEASGEGAVRLLVTRGGSSHAGTPLEVAQQTVIMFERKPQWGASMRLLPMHVPWHPGGVAGWETAKSLSYAPNVMTTRRARAAGFDDALCLTAEGAVLDGPNFAVGWFRRGVFEAPCWRRLGMLESTSMTLALAAAEHAGIEAAEGVFPLEAALEASEVCVLSSTRDLLPVSAIGKVSYEAAGPQLARLREAIPHVLPRFR